MVTPVAPFPTQRRGQFNAVRLQGRQMPGMACRTTMGIRTAVFVVVEIQGDGCLNASKAHQQEYG
jgi:hypothetical protein